MRASAELLGHCGHYVFVSSVSVYADMSIGPDVESPVAELGDASADELAPDYSNYGALKALCEQAVWDVFRERTLVVRPGVGAWLELPLWIADPAWAGMHRADVGHALAAGLRFRPLTETIAGAAAAPAVDGVGLTPEREAELLAAWHAR